MLFKKLFFCSVSNFLKAKKHSRMLVSNFQKLLLCSSQYPWFHCREELKNTHIWFCQKVMLKITFQSTIFMAPFFQHFIVVLRCSGAVNA